MNQALRNILFIAAALLCGCEDEPAPKDKTAYPFVTDAQGRALILHGINVMSNAKRDPLRMPAIDQEDVRRMVEDWGFNHVRFLIFWDAIEPEPGQYDTAYFDRVAERLDWFAEAGIHVVLDMHQDVYAARFCCDGAPEWAIRDDGEAFELQDRWYLNYFQPAVLAAFDNFWDEDGPHGDLQVHYRESWAQVVKRFADHPAVIGYDLMNEPSSGSMTDGAELLGMPSENSLSPIFDETELTPFYQALIDRIRQEDTTNWIFFEPRYGGPANGSRSWLGPFTDPRPGRARLAYYPHLYSIRLEAGNHYDPDQDATLTNWEASRSAELAAQNMPMAIGEFGLTRRTENWEIFLDRVLAMTDRMLAGWAYWSYDPGDWGIIEGPERTETPYADVLTRPYARAVAGTPTSMGYDPQSGTFHLEFVEREGVEGATELYIPVARHYPQGIAVQVDGASVDASVGWDERREILSLQVPKTGGAHRIEVTSR